MHRRTFLQGLFASLGVVASATSPFGFAQAQGSADNGRRFLFIFANGGWDPLCVFAPKFGVPTIDMEAEATLRTHLGFQLVDHPARPNVRAFFDKWGAQTALINGINVRSVAHDICTQLMMTSSPDGTNADWPSTIAASSGTPIPELVLSGPTFPGPHSALVSQLGINQQLKSLINGDLQGALPVGASDQHGTVIDNFVRSRTERFALGMPQAPLLAKLASSHARALSLADTDLAFSAGSFPEYQSPDGQYVPIRLTPQSGPAIQALAKGISRVVAVGEVGDRRWDSHGDNAEQILLFDGLFTELSTTLDGLANTAGPDGKPLLESTTVVVMSEMGRTPKFNSSGGRDHWPYTSAMLIGSGIRGGQSYGEFDDRFVGIGVDPDSGELDLDVPGISTGQIGATLFALAGVEAPSLIAEPPLRGLLL